MDSSPFNVVRRYPLEHVRHCTRVLSLSRRCCPLQQRAALWPVQTAVSVNLRAQHRLRQAQQTMGSVKKHICVSCGINVHCRCILTRGRMSGFACPWHTSAVSTAQHVSEAV